MTINPKQFLNSFHSYSLKIKKHSVFATSGLKEIASLIPAETLLIQNQISFHNE